MADDVPGSDVPKIALADSELDPPDTEKPGARKAGEKRVTFAELFFDLVFVFAITQLSALLHDDHSWAGLGKAAILLIPIYWGWVGISLHSNFHDVDRTFDRLAIFGVGLANLMMALAITEAFADRGRLYGASYFVIRVILAAVIFRGWPTMVNGFSVGLTVTGPLLLLGGFLEPGFRLLCWAVAGAIDLSLPFILRRKMAGSKFHSSHLVERFGLFVIIALGESIVAIGSPVAGGNLVNSELVAVALAFVLACGLWWVYFAFAAGAMLHAVESAPRQTEVVREVLSYGHLLIIGSIISLAVGLTEAVAHPLEKLPLDIAALLFGGCALYLATFGYTRWRMFRRISTTRLSCAALLLVLLPLATRVDAVVSVGAIAAVLIALNFEEHRRVRAGTA